MSHRLKFDLVQSHREIEQCRMYIDESELLEFWQSRTPMQME